MKYFLTCAVTLLLACTLNGRTLAEPGGVRQIKIGKVPGAVLEAGKVQIVLQEDAADTTRFAAKELSFLLGDVLGESVPIVTKVTAGMVPIFLGAGSNNAMLDINKLYRDGYFIQIKNGAVRIAGHDNPNTKVEKDAIRNGVWSNFHERGTLFGVYEFLERFAQCRFYFPGKLGTILPQQAKISLPEVDIEDRPDWPGRQLHGFYTPSEYFEGEGEERFAFKHPGKNLQQYRLRMSTQYPLPSLHGLARMNLPERFGKTHPEYFRMKEDGTREAGDRGHYGAMPCFSSGIREEIYADVKAMLIGDVSHRPGLEKSTMWRSQHEQWIKRKIIDVMPGDSFAKCYCPKCQAAYTDDEHYATNIVWGFVAEIARKLQADGFTDAIVAQSAYYPYQAIPEFDLPDNIEVGVCVTGPYDMYNPIKLNRDNELIRNWSKKIGKKVMLSNYGYKRQLEGIPNPTPKAYAQYFSSQFEWTGGEFLFYNNTDRFMYTTLQDYIFSKIAWDNSSDFSKLYDEYYANMFGPASSIMRKTLERFEDIWLQKIGGRTIETDIGPISSFPSTTEIWMQIYNEEMLKTITDEFNQAEKMTSGIHLERVQLFRREFLDPLSRGRQMWLVASSLPEGLIAFADTSVTLASHANSKTAPLKTDVVCKMSNDELNIVFDCEESTPETMSVADRKADDPLIWQDNSVEIFLNPDCGRKVAYHFIVNSKGTLSDAKVIYHGKDGNHDWNYNTNAKVKVMKGSKNWTAEISIPLASLPDLRKEGFPVNFCRSRIVDGENDSLYTWSPLVHGFGDIEQFGSLIFTKPRIKNYSFSTPLKGSGWSERNQGTVERDANVFFSAPAAVRLESNEKMAEISHAIAGLKANTKYRLSCMIKTENLSSVGAVGGACLKFQDAPGHQKWMPSPALKGTNDWCRYTCDFQTAEKMDPNPRLNLWIYNGIGKAWFDDVVIEEIK